MRKLALASIGVVAISGLFIAWRWQSLRSDSDPAVDSVFDAMARLETDEMVKRLKRISVEMDPQRNAFQNSRRAALYGGLLGRPMPPSSEFELRMQYALELVRAGQARRGVEALETAESLISRLDPEAIPARWLYEQFLGLAYLRLAEEENCIARPSCDACLLPIRGSGIHSVTTGARGAIEHYTAALRANPRDLSSLWLMNIAYMTLGEHPKEVPQQWLIPAEVFKSTESLPRYLDVAPEYGLDVLGLSGGAIVDDFNRDGRLDVLCSSWGILDPLRFFLQNSDGRFEDRSEEAGLTGLSGGLNMVHADYDNDGDLDVLVLRGAWMGDEGKHPNSLLRNRGDGRFDDVTRSAGILSLHPTQTAAWLDFDGDGWLDLFIGNETDKGVHPCEMYRNLGDGSFVECSEALGVNVETFVKGVAAGDYDNDGRMDLYLSVLDGPNLLLHNDGPGGEGDANDSRIPAWRFSDRARQAGVDEPKLSFPTWFFDFDNDGWLDIFVASYGWEATTEFVAADYLGRTTEGPRPRLYRNSGDGKFEDVTKAMGLDVVLIAMGSNYGDLDGDGFLDMYIGTGEPSLSALMPNRMFRNRGGKSFVDVSSAGGFGHLQKGHGVAFADIDEDGDQDIYAVLGGAYEGDVYRNALFRNPGRGSGGLQRAARWLKLDLQGTDSNRDAIGARIEVRLRTPSGVRSIHSVVSSGGSFGGSCLRREIGLGDAEEVLSVQVRWPSGRVQVYSSLPLDSKYHLVEGVAEAKLSP